jgi:O-antigen/teichoic acid export membrane protein
MKISMLKCQTRLMVVWIVGCMLLLIVAWLQNILGHYGEDGQDVIAWLSPSIVPTLSLVTGVWISNTRKKYKSKKQVDKNLYYAVLGASIVYLTFIAMVFAIQPFVARPPIEVVKGSSPILAPLQGVMCAFIGIFFNQSSEK